MTFLERHSGKLILSAAVLVTVGLVIACVIPGSPVLPFLMGTGIFSFLASSTIPAQIAALAGITFGSTLFAQLSLTGIGIGIKNFYNWCVGLFRGKSQYLPVSDFENVTIEEDETIVILSDSSNNESFLSKHWGKILLGVAVIGAVVAMVVATPYILPFLPAVAVAAPAIQYLVVGLIGLASTLFAELSLVGLGWGAVKAVKTLTCYQEQEKDGYEFVLPEEETEQTPPVIRRFGLASQGESNMSSGLFKAEINKNAESVLSESDDIPSLLAN